jgi:molybdopterin-guanine dinucleotide biosynthesis protein A
MEPSMPEERITAVVLAGGKSERFGSDKATYPVDGLPMIEHPLAVLKNIFSEIIIISGNVEGLSYLGFPVYPDMVPSAGPLCGLYTALHHADRGSVFLTACDMPHLDEKFIRYLTGLPGDFDIVVPVVNGWYETLHAVYSTSCLPSIERLLKGDDRRIMSVFEGVRVRAIEENEIRMFGDPARMFANINYPG